MNSALRVSRVLIRNEGFALPDQSLSQQSFSVTVLDLFFSSLSGALKLS